MRVTEARPRAGDDVHDDLRRPLRTASLEELALRLERRDVTTLIDVRERSETEEGIIPGALCIPHAELAHELQARGVDRRTPIVVYCESGRRAELAGHALRQLGYEDVSCALPGFRRWQELGLPVEGSPMLSPAQRSRYARHLALEGVGASGQARLLASRVLVVGLGGLGSPAALYLAASGVGTLGLVDPDVVDGSNLQRQVLHTTSRIGAPKVASATQALADLNPDVRLVPFEERLDGANVERIVDGFDVVLDGSDNFATRYLLNDVCFRRGVPVVHGSVFRFEGQVTTFVPGQGPCYRCLYPEPPPAVVAPNCSEEGVLGVLPGVIGVLQATEVLKLLVGIGTRLVGRLLHYDAASLTMRELRYERDPACAGCGAFAPSAGVSIEARGCVR